MPANINYTPINIKCGPPHSNPVSAPVTVHTGCPSETQWQPNGKGPEKAVTEPDAQRPARVSWRGPHTSADGNGEKTFLQNS